MVSHYKLSLLFVVGVILLANFLQAQMESKSETANKIALVNEFLGQIQFVEGRIMDLAKAIPADKYTWRPAEGIRSIAEAHRHITFANDGFSKMSGLESSESPEMEGKMKDFEKATTNKDKILEDLTQSFEKLKAAVSSISQAQLDEQIEVFGMKMSRRSFVIGTLNHLHEHLGQSIAYARMNGVVPPWSR